MTNVLLICHGSKHQIGMCPITQFFPLTLKIMKDCSSVDINPDCEPDYIEDFSLPTKIRRKFHYAIGICCNCNIYINTNGELNPNFFNNIIKILKPNGLYFIDSIPLYAVIYFASFLLLNNIYLENEKNIKPKWFKKDLLNKSKIQSIIKKREENINITRLFMYYIQFQFPQLQIIKSKTEIKEIILYLSSKYYDDELKEILLYKYNKENNCFIFKKNNNLTNIY